MDGSLPFFGPSLDFSTVPPIEPNKILNYFNQFVSNSVQLLNKFANVCDTKLEDLNYRLQDVEATLSILEAKLSSVPCLEHEPSTTQHISGDPTPSTEETVLPHEVHPTIVPVAHQVEEDVAPTENPDPEINRFLKMLQFGVPLPAVQQKMRAEGHDPALLNRKNPPNPSSFIRREDTDSSDNSLSSSDE